MYSQYKLISISTFSLVDSSDSIAKDLVAAGLVDGKNLVVGKDGKISVCI